MRSTARHDVCGDDVLQRAARNFLSLLRQHYQRRPLLLHPRQHPHLRMPPKEQQSGARLQAREVREARGTAEAKSSYDSFLRESSAIALRSSSLVVLYCARCASCIEHSSGEVGAPLLWSESASCPAVVLLPGRVLVDAQSCFWWRQSGANVHRVASRRLAHQDTVLRYRSEAKPAAFCAWRKCACAFACYGYPLFMPQRNHRQGPFDLCFKCSVDTLARL
jgi:hypothetical protein